MKDGESFSVQFDARRRGRGNGDADGAQIGEQAVVRKIGVAPDEGQRAVDEFVENFDAADIAAVDHVCDGKPIKQVQRFSHREESTVTV